jgi:hypothetical protein
VEELDELSSRACFESRPTSSVRQIRQALPGPRSVPGVRHAWLVPDVVSKLLATEAALDKLGARGITVVEAEQTIWNLHVVVKNRRGRPERRQPGTCRLLIGRSDANRGLTLVIEETIEPTTWLLITGWDATPAERMLLGKS